MTLTLIMQRVTKILLVSTLLWASISGPFISAQGTPGGNTPSGPQSSGAAVPQASVGTQTYSVEGDMLAYKSLQSDGEAIACDAAFAMPGGTVALKANKAGVVQTACADNLDLSAANVLVLSSADQTVANYQMWRLAVVTLDALNTEAAALVPTPAAGAGGRSFSGVETAVSSTLAIIQTIGSFFVTNESVAGIQGTPQDLALVDIVSRQLRVMGARVYAPGTFSPFALSGLDYTNSPFLARFQAIQTIRNQLAAALADKIQWDSNLQMVATDQAQIKSLSDEDDANKKNGKPAVNAAKIATLNSEIANKQQQNDQLKANYDDDSLAKVSNAKVTSMIQSIDTFTMALINSATASSSPSNPTGNASAPSGPATTNPGGTQNPTTSPQGTGGGMGNNQTTQAANNPANTPATPPIPPLVSILYADGLARALGATRDKLAPPTTAWRIISLKELETGATVIARARFFGTKILYGGGAAATYAIFDFNGNLYCSATVFDYGGRLEGKSFNSSFRTPDIDPSAQLIFSRGRCKALAEAPAK
jgi:hypothetical protein